MVTLKIPPSTKILTYTCKWTTSGAPSNIDVAHCLPVSSIQLLCSLIPPWYIEFWGFRIQNMRKKVKPLKIIKAPNYLNLKNINSFIEEIRWVILISYFGEILVFLPQNRQYFDMRHVKDDQYIINLYCLSHAVSISIINTACHMQSVYQ